MSHTSRAIQGFCLLAVGVLVGRWTVTIDTVSAQEPSKRGAREILIGSVPIHLGDLEESTLNALRKQYEVLDGGKVRYRTGQAEFFFVRTTKEALSTSLGNFNIQQGRVVDVTRYWGDIDAPQEAFVSFFQQLYGALESASAETPTSVLRCRTFRKPHGVITTIMFDFSGRTASLNLVQREKEGKHFNEMTVEEGLTNFVGQ
jgi:hypothetical protein